MLLEGYALGVGESGGGGGEVTGMRSIFCACWNTAPGCPHEYLMKWNHKEECCVTRGYKSMPRTGLASIASSIMKGCGEGKM